MPTPHRTKATIRPRNTSTISMLPIKAPLVHAIGFRRVIIGSAGRAYAGERHDESELAWAPAGRQQGLATGSGGHAEAPGAWHRCADSGAGTGAGAGALP